MGNQSFTLSDHLKTEIIYYITINFKSHLKRTYISISMQDIRFHAELSPNLTRKKKKTQFSGKNLVVSPKKHTKISTSKCFTSTVSIC